MPARLLLSTAYFPPTDYFSLIKNSESVIIEKEENYIKQSYRNRCRILTSNGILVLSVPVMKGPFLKTPIKDVVIDYSKRWQKVHLRALSSSYGTSPYFQFYFEDIEKAVLENHKYLLDLNLALLTLCLVMLKLKRSVVCTDSFETVENRENDFRYILSPKSDPVIRTTYYTQVFNKDGFVPGLSILDLLFNMGPESLNYL